MSNDEGIWEDEVTRAGGYSSFRFSSLIPPRIGYRRKALAKFGLLSLRFDLLVRLACLLLRTRT